MKIIKPKDPETISQERTLVHKRYIAIAGCCLAVMLFVAAVAVPDGVGIPKALADPTTGSSELYVPDMMTDEPDYGTYDSSARMSFSGDGIDTNEGPSPYSVGSELIIDVKNSVPAGRLVTAAEDEAAEYAALTAPDDTGVDDVPVTDAAGDRVQQQGGGYVPTAGTADQTPSRSEYDGELAALRQEVADLRQKVENQGNQGSGSDTSEADALRQEINRLQALLDAQEKTTQNSGTNVQTEQKQDDSETSGAELTPEPTLPPDWLVPNTGSDNTSTSDTGVPEWLYGTFMTAVINNPYDGGPLCKASYATVPAGGYGMRVRCELDIRCSQLTQGDLLAFVQRVVLTTEADWVTIIGSDGKGIQFTGGDSDSAYYGPLDEYGRVTEAEYYISLTSKGYTYERILSGSAARSVDLLSVSHTAYDVLASAATGKHYARIFPGMRVQDMTQQDLRQAVCDVAGIDDCDWVLIAGVDGYGVQFYAGNTDTGYYGDIDDNGNVHTASFVLQWDGGEYLWIPCVG